MSHHKSALIAPLTHLAGFGLLLAGWLASAPILLATGAFSLAGSLTNALAIHLIFVRVPGVIGSGVILTRFHAIKSGLSALVLSKLFNEQSLNNIAQHLVDTCAAQDDEAVSELTDELFEKLVTAVASSSLSSLLSMAGGAKVLEPLRPHIAQQVPSILRQSARRIGSSEKMRRAIDEAVRQRIDLLTPTQIRDLVADLIREYLGWLVMWGGVMGGVIGAAWYAANGYLGSPVVG